MYVYTYIHIHIIRAYICNLYIVLIMPGPCLVQQHFWRLLFQVWPRLAAFLEQKPHRLHPISIDSQVHPYTCTASCQQRQKQMTSVRRLPRRPAAIMRVWALPLLSSVQSVRATSRYQAYDSGFDPDDLQEAREWKKRFEKSRLPKGQTSYSRSSGPGGQNVNKYGCDPPLSGHLQALFGPQLTSKVELKRKQQHSFPCQLSFLSCQNSCTREWSHQGTTHGDRMPWCFMPRPIEHDLRTPKRMCGSCGRSLKKSTGNGCQTSNPGKRGESMRNCKLHARYLSEVGLHSIPYF